MPTPTSPLLDAFTRPDEDPAGGSWLNPIFSGDSGLKVVSNAATGRAGGGSESYWKNPFPASQEAWCTLVTRYTNNDAGLSLFLNVQSPGTGSMSCYAAAIYRHSGSGLDLAEIYRFDSTTPNNLGTSGTLTVANGDRYWFRNLAGALALYQVIGGVWAPILSVTDATYGAGFIAFGCDDATLVIDDCGGGAVGRNASPRIGGQRPYPFSPGNPNFPSRF